jgi:PilZ domain
MIGGGAFMAFQYLPPQQDASDKRSWANRRASVRYQCGPATAGRVNVAEKHEFLRAWVMDLSAHGIGLLVSRRLDIGQLVIISMKNTSGEHSYEMAARVAHISPHVQGEWVIGFELQKSLNYDDLDALL